MDRKVVSLAAALCLMGVSACAPQIASNGFQPVDNKPQDVKVGADTRSTVLSKLGSPSAVSTFDPNTWYYISQTTEQYAYYKPKVEKRTVVSIAFDKDEKVTAVKDLSLKDGFKIAYASQQTPTRGKELNWLQQILGTIGRGGSMLNPNDQDPGQRPGQGH
jgi:outer membrane protein assembly factor BamE (lipoprotein component of BamABCDE complex)